MSDMKSEVKKQFKKWLKINEQAIKQFRKRYRNPELFDVISNGYKKRAIDVDREYFNNDEEDVFYG
jgi:ribosome recycling factor